MKNIKWPKTFSIEWIKNQYQKEEMLPERLVEEIILRAEREKDMNIWITPPDLAFIQPFLDHLQKLDKEKAPLWGIPFAIKDNIDLAGVPTTAGCPDYSYTPKEHAIIVQRLVEAGAIPVGKANLDQFATGLVGTRSPYGETPNSLNKELISGGSSSGSAVAVALGQAAFSLGTDTAGSGRIPAALNRLFGLKPSVGAWPTKGVVPACASLDCPTVFAHSLDDVHLVDSIVRGVHSEDPWSKSIPLMPDALPNKLYVPKEPLEFFGTYETEYRNAWEAVLEKIETLNIPIEYIDTSLFKKTAAFLYDGPIIAERWAAVGKFIEEHPGAALPVTEKILRTGASEKYTAASLYQTLQKLELYKLETKKLLKDAVLLMPTSGGTWTREEVRQHPIQTNSDMGKYTNHCNLLDLSAMAVPSEDADNDLPFGITLFALSDQENLTRGLARLFEGKKPSVKEKETTHIAVCGLHMRGFPLENQMKEFGATFIREDKTAGSYSLVKLNTEPSKPGLIKKQQGGSAIAVEVWSMPVHKLEAFMETILAPLAIGKVELQDGTVIPGFVCEGNVSGDEEDITRFGGWRSYVSQQTTILEEKRIGGPAI